MLNKRTSWEIETFDHGPMVQNAHRSEAMCPFNTINISYEILFFPLSDDVCWFSFNLDFKKI